MIRKSDEKAQNVHVNFKVTPADKITLFHCQPKVT